MSSLRSFALASLLLAPPAVAQWTPFPPPGMGSLAGPGQAVLPVDWESKPALLILGGWGPFVRYDAQHPHFTRWQVPTPIFRLAAAFFVDWRPCAQGAEVYLHNADEFTYMRFGPLQAGSLTWMPGFGQGFRVAYDRRESYNPKWYEVSYCHAPTNNCGGRCTTYPGYADGPQFVAVVLVVEGIAW